MIKVMRACALALLALAVCWPSAAAAGVKQPTAAAKVKVGKPKRGIKVAPGVTAHTLSYEMRRAWKVDARGRSRVARAAHQFEWPNTYIGRNNERDLGCWDIPGSQDDPPPPACAGRYYARHGGWSHIAWGGNVLMYGNYCAPGYPLAPCYGSNYPLSSTVLNYSVAEEMLGWYVGGAPGAPGYLVNLPSHCTGVHGGNPNPYTGVNWNFRIRGATTTSLNGNPQHVRAVVLLIPWGEDAPGPPVGQPFRSSCVYSFDFIGTDMGVTAAAGTSVVYHGNYVWGP